MGRKRTESAQCKVAEKCASRVRVRGRETRNAMEQCGVRIAGREEGVVTVEEGEGFAVQACRERQCQCACGRRVGWRCGSSRCVKSHRVSERNCVVLLDTRRLGASFEPNRSILPTIRAYLSIPSV